MRENEQTRNQARNTSTTARVNARPHAINPINYPQESVKKKRDQCIDFQLNIDNLPLVLEGSGSNRGRGTAQQSRGTAQQPKRRKLFSNNNPNPKNDTSINFYDIEDTFRGTNAHFKGSRGNHAPQQPQVNSSRNPPFRTSLDRYQLRTTANGTARNRYISLDVSSQQVQETVNNAESNSVTLSTKPNVSDHMNKTFGVGGFGVGQRSRNNDSIPKWSDESERIRSILNQTITGHGSRHTRR